MAQKKDTKKPSPVMHYKPKAVAAMGNPLIETFFKMDPLELKLFVFICSLIHEEHDFYTYEFTVEQAAKALGRKFDRNHQRFYSDLKKISKSILKVVIELPGFIPYEGSSPCDRQTNLFDFFDYRESAATVDVGIKEWLKPYLLSLKKEFTRIAIREFSRLQSFYGLKLFMLLEQYKKFGRRKFTVEDLRYSLGISANEYLRWDSFVEKVLKTAINDIRRADLYEVEMFFYKRGRKIHEVEFKFYKPGEERNVTPTSEELADLTLIAQNMQRYSQILKEEKDLFDDEEAAKKALERLKKEIKKSK